jgi:3-deoxy-D-manno-octulosonic-acid transferase
MLRQLTQVAAQHADDAQRFQSLGVDPDACTVTGNIKFDLQLDEAIRLQARPLKQQLSSGGERLVWIAASTHAGEDEQLLEAFNRLRQVDHPAAQGLLLVLVPRHPERFERVGQLCANRGFKVVHRSSGKPVSAGVDVLLGDTMGELLLLFGASDFAFMGGSLVPVGGHNFIEPAAWGLPLLSGPHIFNFSEVSRLLIDAGGLEIVETQEELAEALKELVINEAQREARGRAAQAVADANRGALEKTLTLVRQYL